LGRIVVALAYFGGVPGGNLLTTDDERRKLELVASAAARSGADPRARVPERSRGSRLCLW
jgi:hypothetical protein